MKIDISRAQVRTAPNNGLISSIEPFQDGFLVRFGDESTGFYENVRDLCSSLDVKPERLRAAVEFEGYEIDGYEIRRIRLPGMDERGVIQNKGMKAEYLDRVRDWQWVRRGERVWSDFWGESKDLRLAKEDWISWRPKSYATVEGAGDLQSVHGVWDHSLKEVRVVRTPVQAEQTPASECDKCDGYSHPTEACDTDEVETVDHKSRVEIEFQVPEEAEQLARDCALMGMPRALLYPERVERTSEGQITVQGNPDREVTAQRVREAVDQSLNKPGGKQKADTEPNPYERIALDLAALVADKQRQYGDSAGRTGAILRVLYPDGVPPDAYDRALLVVRVLDKLSRLATNKVDLGGESPWRDIAGYALLAIEKGF